MTSGPGPGAVLRAFIDAYGRGEMTSAGDLLADDLRAYVTNEQATADVVRGRQAFMARAPDLQAAAGSATITQVLEIDDQQALAMVEIRAARNGRRLHNFGAFLATVADGRITELRMVDAKPAESDAFWR